MLLQQFSLVSFLNIHSYVNKANEESDEYINVYKDKLFSVKFISLTTNTALSSRCSFYVYRSWNIAMKYYVQEFSKFLIKYCRNDYLMFINIRCVRSKEAY
jgi:hypothetical protein